MSENMNQQVSGASQGCSGGKRRSPSWLRALVAVLLPLAVFLFGLFFLCSKSLHENSQKIEQGRNSPGAAKVDHGLGSLNEELEQTNKEMERATKQVEDATRKVEEIARRLEKSTREIEEMTRQVKELNKRLEKLPVP